MFIVQRIYSFTPGENETLVLVDRIWPRGITKDKFPIHSWMKEIAPSDALRKWFSHDPKKWDEFRKRYFKELKKKEELVKRLLESGKKKKVILLFGARDERHNNATALKEYLDKQG